MDDTVLLIIALLMSVAALSAVVSLYIGFRTFVRDNYLVDWRLQRETNDNIIATFKNHSKTIDAVSQRIDAMQYVGQRRH